MTKNNWLREYGINEVKSEPALDGDAFIIPHKEKKQDWDWVEPPLASHFWHGFYIMGEDSPSIDLQVPVLFEAFQKLFELIEKTDLIRVILSPLVIHNLNPVRFSHLSFLTNPRDKSVCFKYKEDKKFVLEELEIANKILPKALKKTTEPITLFRAVDWNCNPLSPTFDEDFGNLVLARARYSFLIGKAKK